MHRLYPALLLLMAYLPAAARLPTDTLSESATISILTILPGDEIYSMFGHTAVRVRDPQQDIDQTYNYGTFDFGNPVFFAFTFAYGQLDYFLSDTSFPRIVRFYRDVARRPIIEQVLNLDHAQRVAIFRFLKWNALPENRGYRYDFLYDNCSTRVRDAFYDRFGSLRFHAPPPGTTFRRMLDPYSVDRPFLDFGWDLLMGTPMDRDAPAWDGMFLPDYLMLAADSATIERDGERVPFVARKDTLFWIPGRSDPGASAPWPSIVMWAFFAAGFALAAHQRTGGAPRFGAWFDATLFGIVGVAGLMMLFMWFVSLHSVTMYNWNLLWAWPAHLVAAVAFARRSEPRWLRGYLIAAVILAMTTLLGWTLWPQELHSASIPLILLIALRSAWHAFGTAVPRARTAPVSVN